MTQELLDRFAAVNLDEMEAGLESARKIIAAAETWGLARLAFLALPPNSSDASRLLGDLANAEEALMRAVAGK